MNLIEQKEKTFQWFKEIQNIICNKLEEIEEEFGQNKKFAAKDWQHDQQGGGQMRIIRSEIFEKGGVNVSQVSGKFSEEFAKKIPHVGNNREFWASGISIVIHPKSPLIPAIHMNTRFLCTAKSWFGGGIDLTPMIPNEELAEMFHVELKQMCDQHDKNHYPKFKKQCDKYFFLPHRNEPRGIGGIFYDYHNNGDFEKDFLFTQDVGKFFADFYPKVIRKYVEMPWSNEQRNQQLVKRGRYVEFNLLYDRGTQFGLQTNGNIEAIFMSMPPKATW